MVCGMMLPTDAPIARDEWGGSGLGQCSHPARSAPGTKVPQTPRAAQQQSKRKKRYLHVSAVFGTVAQGHIQSTTFFCAIFMSISFPRASTTTRRIMGHNMLAACTGRYPVAGQLLCDLSRGRCKMHSGLCFAIDYAVWASKQRLHTQHLLHTASPRLPIPCCSRDVLQFRRACMV